MTLDASGAPVAAAPVPPRDDPDRSPEAPDEGLRILKALLADPSAVSSEEAVIPSGPMPEPSSRESAFDDGNDSDRLWSDRLPPDGSFADLVPAPPVPALQPAPGSVPEPDTGVSAGAAATDSLAALSDGLRDSVQDLHAELDDDTARWDAQAERADASSVPTKGATRLAGSATLEESAGTSRIEDVSSRDVVGEDDLLVVGTDTRGARVLHTVAAAVDATGAEDSGEREDAGDTGFDWRGSATTPEAADPETPADPPIMDQRADRGDSPGEHSSRESAVSVAAIAALLDEALVRDIGEMPSVSSDSPSSDAAGGAALAARPHDAGAEHLREGSSGPLSESVPRDPDTASAVDSPPHGAASPTSCEEPVAAVRASLEAAEGMVPAEQEEPEAADESIADHYLDALDDSRSNASPLPRLDEPGLGSFTDVRDPGESVDVLIAEAAADAREVEIGGGPDSADQLPHLGIAPRAETEASGHGTLVREITDAAADSSGEVAERGDAVVSGAEEDGAADESVGTSGPVEEFVPAGGGAQDAPGFDAPAFGTRNSDSIDRDATPAHEKAFLIPGSPIERTGVDELAAGDASGATSGSDDAHVQEGASPVICLPDLGGMSPSKAASGGDASLLQSTEDVARDGLGDPAGLPSPGFSRPDDTSARAHVESPEYLAESKGEVADPESSPVIALPGSGDESDAALRSLGIEADCEPGEPPRGLAGRAEEETAGAALVDALLRDIAGSSSVSSDQVDTPDTASGVSVPDDDSDLDAGRPAGRGPGATSVEPFDPVSSGADSSIDRTDSGETTALSSTDAAAAASTEDAAATRDGGVEEVADRVIHLPDLSGSPSFGRATGPDDALLRQIAEVVAASAGEAVESSEVDANGHDDDAPARDPADVQEDTEEASPDDARREYASGTALPEPRGMEDGVDPIGSGVDADARADPGLGLHAAESLDPGAPGSADEPSGSGAAPTTPPERAPVGSAHTEDASRPGQAGLEDSHGSTERAADEAALEDSFPEDAGVFVLPDPGDAPASDRPVENREHGESHRWPDDPAEEAETATSGIVFDDSLALDLAETVPVSFDEAVAAEPAFDISLPDAQTTASDPSAEEPAPSYADVSLEAAPPGPAAALAFATDADTEMALRDGLLGFGGASAGTDEAQVWQGGLRAAIAALAEGRSAPLVIVDIDGLPYPAGAIHELAAVCEVGTVVIAVGSDDSARPGRELLLAGVSDYLAKPLTAEAVRDVAGRALADAAASRPGGLVVSFAGCGGSGATTMATAAALQAAARGCYVSVLDLSRSVPAAALALGVDPVAGLDQLLETAAREAVEPEALEGVCARRSDRIEVYAHRWSPEHPAAASAEAVDSLLAVLRLRSQMVVVDGLDEAWTRFLPAAEIDTQVFIAEPTAGKTPQVARMASLLKDTRPLVFVQNHTRAFRRNGGGQVLRNAGIGIEPDVVVPFDPAVAQAADWGWPQDRLPRSVRKPVTALTDRLLGASPGAGAAPLTPARAA